MKKLLLGIILLMSILGCSFLEKEAEWTILVYMAADNGLTGDAEEDIQEMMAAEFSSDINVIVQVDYGESSDDSSAKRYQIFPGNRQLIKNMGEIDSGDYHTLAEFADWGFDEYPADNYALIIWSHGNGWYDYFNKFCPDKQSGSHISIVENELQQALSSISPKPDLLMFDACNMLTMEIIAEVYKYTDYIIGSELSIPPDGFPYDDLLSKWEDYSTAKTLVPEIVLTFVDSYKPWGSQNPDYELQRPFSCAGVKTREFSALLNDIGNFAENWGAMAADDIFVQARLNCEEFNDLQADVDIKQYFRYIYQNTTDDSLSAMSEQILYDIENAFIAQLYYDYPDSYPDLGSAALWYPVYSDAFDDLRGVYSQLKFDQLTGWHCFLENTFTVPAL